MWRLSSTIPATGRVRRKLIRSFKEAKSAKHDNLIKLGER